MKDNNANNITVTLNLIQSLFKATCPPLEGGPKSLISRRGENTVKCFNTYNDKKCRHPEGDSPKDLQTQNHVITRKNIEQEMQKSVRSDVVIPNELGNGETCQGLRHWRLLPNLKNNFSKPVRNDMNNKNKLDCFAFARNDEKTVTNIFPYFPISFSPKKKIDSSPNALALNGYGFAFHPLLVRLRMTAFTLAEVLITLGIIGVVAAITIPGLINHYKAQRLRTQFLESYSIVQQVFKQMEADDVSLDPTTYSVEEYPKVFGKYLKGATDCNTSRKKPCFDFRKDHYKNLQGENMPAGFNGLLNDGSFLLPNGSLLLIENGGADWGSKILVTVDLNGFGNPPDKLGIDVFTFQLIDGELKTVGDKGTSWVGDYLCNANSTNQWNGISCAQKAKTNTDYFKEMIKKVK